MNLLWPVPTNAIINLKYYKCNLFEFRLAYFLFSDSDIKKIYPNGTIDVEIEYIKWFAPRYSYWTNFNIISKSGKSISLLDPTHISISTWSFGIKEFFLIKKTL